MLQRGQRLDEPLVHPPLINNFNLIDEYDVDATSQLMNPEEGEYPNVNSINSFDMPLTYAPEYMEQELWDPQLQHFTEQLEAQFQHKYNLEPRKDQIPNK